MTTKKEEPRHTQPLLEGSRAATPHQALAREKRNASRGAWRPRNEASSRRIEPTRLTVSILQNLCHLDEARVGSRRAQHSTIKRTTWQRKRRRPRRRRRLQRRRRSPRRPARKRSNGARAPCATFQAGRVSPYYRGRCRAFDQASFWLINTAFDNETGPMCNWLGRPTTNAHGPGFHEAGNKPALSQLRPCPSFPRARCVSDRAGHAFQSCGDAAHEHQ